MASRKEEKEARRQERLAAEAAAKAAEAKKRRLVLLGLISILSVAVVIAAVILTTSSDTQNYNKPPNGKVEVAKFLRGIPQNGQTLGSPKAPVHMVEFADLKCPFCREFDVTLKLPRLKAWGSCFNERCRGGLSRFTRLGSSRAVALAEPRLPSYMLSTSV